MKRKFSALLISGLLLTNIIMSPNSYSQEVVPRKIFSGWMTDYSTYGDVTRGQIQAMDYVVANSEMFGQILPFWYTVTSANKIKDKYVTQNSINKSIPIATLQSLGIKVLPTITDGTGAGVLSKIFNNQADRSTLIDTISKLISDNNFDGIDLNFEGFAYVDKIATWPTIQPRWVQFVKELSISLRSQNKLLSVTTPVLFDPTTGKRGYYHYAWPEIGVFIDRLNIMAYDYHKYDTAPGPIGPINWFEPALNYALKHVSSEKIYIGTPNYGYNWVTNVSGTCPTNTPTSEKKSSNAAIIHQIRAQAILDKPGAVATYNEKFGETNVLYTAEFNGFTAANTPTSCKVDHSAWYVDAQGYGARAKLVEKYGLGGISEWEIGYGDNLAIAEVKKIAIAMGQEKVIGELTISSESAKFGESITFDGKFKLSDGRPVASVPVFLEILRPTGATRRLIGTSGLDGSFQSKLLFGEATSIKFSTDETASRTAGITPEKSIGIARLVSWNIPTSMKRGIGYKITGFIEPRSADVAINLDDGDVTTTVLTTADGRYEFEVTPKKTGIKVYKIVVVPDSRFLGATSALAEVLVR